MRAVLFFSIAVLALVLLMAVLKRSSSAPRAAISSIPFPAPTAMLAAASQTPTAPANVPQPEASSTPTAQPLKSRIVVHHPAIVGHATGKGLEPSRTQFQWDGWDIKINRMGFTDKIKESFGESKTASKDSEFLYVDLTVKNSNHEGLPFAPEAVLKIIVGDNAFDAEDIDPDGEYIKNVEPTLSRRRECYFELPKSVIKDFFLLRFHSFLTDTIDISVSIAPGAGKSK